MNKVSDRRQEKSDELRALLDEALDRTAKIEVRLCKSDDDIGITMLSRVVLVVIVWEFIRPVILWLFGVE